MARSLFWAKAQNIYIMFTKILYEGCPTLQITDIEKGGTTAVVDTIKASMERKRFVIVNDQAEALYLIRLVKDDKQAHEKALPNYVVKVFDCDYKLLFVSKSKSKKWDEPLTKQVLLITNQVAMYDKVLRNGTLPQVKDAVSVAIEKSVNDSIEKVKKLTPSSLDRMSFDMISHWYSTPQWGADKKSEWYYKLIGGEITIKRKVMQTLQEIGFAFDYDTLRLTPTGVLDACNDTVYDTCIDYAVADLKTKIDGITSIQDWDKDFSVYSKKPWVRLAIERLGGLKKVKTDLVKPKVASLVQAAIDLANENIEKAEQDIAQWKQDISNYKQYLS